MLLYSKFVVAYERLILNSVIIAVTYSCKCNSWSTCGVIIATEFFVFPPKQFLVIDTLLNHKAYLVLVWY